MKGKFISIEAMDHAGKTTNSVHIADRLTQAGITFIRTREPGGTPLAEDIRALLLSKDYGAMHEITELLLMFASRAEHVHKVIQPALDKGVWVLCDRFVDSTYAYQSAGRDLSDTPIKILDNLVLNGLRPDLTILLDLPVEIAKQRAGSEGATDRFEEEHYDFFEKVRTKYLLMAENDSDRYRIVNAEYSLDNVQRQIDTIINEILN